MPPDDSDSPTLTILSSSKFSGSSPSAIERNPAPIPKDEMPRARTRLACLSTANVYPPSSNDDLRRMLSTSAAEAAPKALESFCASPPAGEDDSADGLK